MNNTETTTWNTVTIERLTDIKYSLSKTIDGETTVTNSLMRRYKINGEEFEWNINLFDIFEKLAYDGEALDIGNGKSNTSLAARLMRAGLIERTYAGDEYMATVLLNKEVGRIFKECSSEG